MQNGAQDSLRQEAALASGPKMRHFALCAGAVLSWKKTVARGSEGCMRLEMRVAIGESEAGDKAVRKLWSLGSAFASLRSVIITQRKVVPPPPPAPHPTSSVRAPPLRRLPQSLSKEDISFVSTSGVRFWSLATFLAHATQQPPPQRKRKAKAAPPTAAKCAAPAPPPPAAAPKPQQAAEPRCEDAPALEWLCAVCGWHSIAEKGRRCLNPKCNLPLLKCASPVSFDRRGNALQTAAASAAPCPAAAPASLPATTAPPPPPNAAPPAATQSHSIGGTDYDGGAPASLAATAPPLTAAAAANAAPPQAPLSYSVCDASDLKAWSSAYACLAFCMQNKNPGLSSLTSAISQFASFISGEGAEELRRNTVCVRAIQENGTMSAGVLWGSLSPRVSKGKAVFMIQRIAILPSRRKGFVSDRLWASLRDEAWRRALHRSEASGGGGAAAAALHSVEFLLVDVTCVQTFGKYWWDLWQRESLSLPDQAAKGILTPPVFDERDWLRGMDGERFRKWKHGSPTFSLVRVQSSCGDGDDDG